MKKLFNILLSTLLMISLVTEIPSVRAEESSASDTPAVNTDGYEVIGGVDSFSQDGNIITIALGGGNKLRISFLSQDIFRYYIDIDDSEFLEFAKPRNTAHKATIVERPDSEFIADFSANPTVSETDETLTIETNKVKLNLDKKTALLEVRRADGSLVFKEASPIMYNNSGTVQSLVEHQNEYYYGGGTQNGRFSHKGQSIRIVNTNNWVDGGVASPNPFYWSTNGYGVVRNTFEQGEYDFGNNTPGVVQTHHNEQRFDAYYFVGDTPIDILNLYTDLTGKPAELPDYAFYLSHLNCYNRDAWKEVPEGTHNAKHIDGKYYIETNRSGSANEGEMLESLMPKNGNDAVTAKKQIDLHADHDMPFGWFLPNDGYACYYGQSDNFDGDIEELAAFTEYANSVGVEVGLWTQTNLWPEDIDNPKKGERDIRREVQEAGLRATKTDVAWVGHGYSMALDGVMRAYEAIAELGGAKPAIVSLDGWAGTQRYSGIWTGDQYGGNWEYIRFHIPTLITTGLSGNPYVGSDMDGIWGGQNPTVQTRDFQWKAFTPYMLDMDGWGSSQKNPWEMGEPYTSLNRAYLKLKAELMPYISTTSKFSAQTGAPMLRPMFFEEANAYTYGKDTQYQFMWGDSILVAPIYQNTNMDADGNDIRNNIYLPGTTDIWIDYITGEHYHGGAILNNFDAPIWKTPVFVKNGAILPKYAENNNPNPVTETNPMGLDKSKRIVEVFPYGNTSYTVTEDDGISVDGTHFSAVYESSVSGDVATVKINKATGTYAGVIAERDHEVIVNVSEAPTGVTGNVNGEDVTFSEVTTLEAYESATGNVYFYNEAPKAIVSEYATEGSKYDTDVITKTPQVWIKSTEKTNIFETDYEVSVAGFKNEQDLDKKELNSDLDAPTNFVLDEVTPTTVSVSWDAVDAATSYEVSFGGNVYSGITATSFLFEDLPFLTDYEIRVRSANKDGYSEWSSVIEVSTLDDPNRNVPKDMSATFSAEGAYAGTPALVVDGDISTQFHSLGNATGEYFTIDLKQVYALDEFEYVPRQDNFGNGTLQDFELQVSIDGTTWKTVHTVGPEGDTPTFTYPNSQQDELVTRSIDFGDDLSARYVRIKVIKSVGGFFTADEIFIHTKDVNAGTPAGDLDGSGEVNEEDFVFLSNYTGTQAGDNDWDYVQKADINYDGIIDAYDIAFVSRQTNGGAGNNNNDVKGKMQVSASQESAKAGDTVTYTIYGLDMADVYAFGLEFALDSEIHEPKAAVPGAISSQMENFSKPRPDTLTPFNTYAVFTLTGDQKRLEGTAVIAEFDVVYKQDVESTDLEIVKAQFIGSNLSVSSGFYDSEPTLPDTTAKLTINDIESLKLTNEYLESDENGDNWKFIFQQSDAFDLLFDGNYTNLAEFVWDTQEWDTPHGGKDVILPMDFEVTFKQPQPISEAVWFNRLPASNGTVSHIKATAYSGETAYDLGEFTEATETFVFEIPSDAGLIDRIVFTPLESRGTTEINNDPQTHNRMLSVYEIEFHTDKAVVVTDIELNLEDEVYLESFDIIDVNVLPGNASNPFVTVTSSDNSVAEVIEVTTETGYEYYLKAVAPGTTTITATSRGNAEITVSKEITVLDEVDVRDLQAAVDKADALEINLYTDASVEALNTVLEEANALIENPTTAQAIFAKTIEVETAIANLESKGSDESREDSAHLIPNEYQSIHSYTNHADQDIAEHVIDGDTDTYWHSSYQSNAKLPVDVVVDLGDVYNLEQVNMLARQNSRNGDVVGYRIEVSTDGENYSAVVQGGFDHNGVSILEREVAKTIKFAPTEARYVKFIATNTLGPENDKYASIAELEFFGLPTSLIPADSIEFEEEAVSIAYGSSHVLEAIINPEEANEAFTWTTSDESIVSIAQIGRSAVSGRSVSIQGVGVGTATITITGVNTSATIEVTVEAAVIEDLVDLVDQTEAFLSDEGETEQIHPALLEQVQAALDAAKALIADEEAQTAEAIIEAYDALQSALNGLNDNVHLVKLQDYVDADLSGYDADSTANYRALLEEANSILENFESIDAVLTINEALEAAAEEFVALDSASLEIVLEIAKSINTGGHTSESVEALETAIENAEAALANATTNAEYETAEAALRTAIENLETETDPGDGDGGTTDPGDGGTTEPGDGGTTEPGDGGTTEPGDSDGGTTEPGDSDGSEELPTTGTQSFAPYAFVMMLLGALFLFFKKRSMNN